MIQIEITAGEQARPVDPGRPILALGPDRRPASRPCESEKLRGAPQ